ncbi:DUF1294 domain-containing protein [Rosistilla oblonga]|uniref:DUF1294 domain-containing protein n=1 Tax=Rosistilla oblonga TaxID=2527990 RepID=UPI003A981638
MFFHIPLLSIAVLDGTGSRFAITTTSLLLAQNDSTGGVGIGPLAMIYAVVMLILSLLSFASYGWDKRQARVDRQRISERRLHTIDLLGGWPGGWVGRRTFRHKTSKRSFVIVFWMTVVLNLSLVGAFFYGLSQLM